MMEVIQGQERKEIPGNCFLDIYLNFDCLTKDFLNDFNFV